MTISLPAYLIYLMKNKEYTSTHHILKYIGIFGSVEALKILANLFRGKITASFLGPFGAGLIAIYQNILDVISSCTNIGLETASIQQLSEIDTEMRQQEAAAMAKVIRTWSMTVAFVALIICIAVATLLSNMFFDEPGHHLDILLLAPAAFLAPISAGECAILKGMHKLKRVASVELITAVAAVISILIIYSCLGINGIIPAINICMAIGTLVHLYFCIQVMPYSIDFLSAETWKRGIPLLKFGIPYAATAIMGAITTTFLYKIISNETEIGLYKTSYALVMYYISVVLSSNAVDYFPRLTSVCHDRKKKTETVNKQIHVSFTLTTPLVMAFLLALPVTVLLLYTKDFLPMMGICIMAGLFQLHRSVALPLEYVSLAHGHSWMFLILEGTYNVLVITLVYTLYTAMGVNGIGMALSAVALANTVILAIVNKFFYNINISARNWLSITIGSCLVLTVMVLCLEENLAIRLGFGIPLTLLSAAYSYWTLRKGIRDEEEGILTDCTDNID